MSDHNQPNDPAHDGDFLYPNAGASTSGPRLPTLRGVPVDNSVEHPRETPVENPVKPQKHAEKNPTNDATYVASTAETCDNRKVNKNAPGSAANTDNPGANHYQGVAELSIPKLPDWIINRDQAIVFLEFAHQDYLKSKGMRTYYARAAKAHGITNAEIGEIFGIAESTVRNLLKNAGDQ